MADPKYSNLPGIDHNQPDVYETSDLPEVDQMAPLYLNEQQSTRPGDVMNQRMEYELVGDDKTQETPEQKYQRVWFELMQLSEDINSLKEGTKEENVSVQCLSRANLLKQAENVKQEIAELNYGEQLGIQSDVNLSDPQGVIKKRLLSELEKFKSFESDKSSTTKAGSISIASGDVDHVNYQLFYRSDQTKLDNTSKFVNLEKRLERLEVVVGKPLDRETPLTSDVTNKSLLGAISCLSSKAKMMEKNLLEEVESRLATIAGRMDQLAEKKKYLEQKDKLDKVSELYNLMIKWNTLSESLPEIVSRLSALKSLHEQALEFSQVLGHLDVTQQQINVQLKVHSDLLKQVQTDFGKNLTMIRANCESMASRFDALKK